MGSIGVKDSYSKALSSYQSASSLNPLNPGIKLSLASIAFSMGNIKDAKDYANQALALKPDYIDALITLSQIAKSEGNNTEASLYAQKALALDPTNKDLIQYFNSLNSSPSTSSSPAATNKSKQ